MVVWVLVRRQLLDKAPQPAGLDSDLLPRLVSLPWPEKTPRTVSLNRELPPWLVWRGRLEKTPQPAGLHSESPPVASASAFPLRPGR
jgi:hypothetical protein